MTAIISEKMHRDVLESCVDVPETTPTFRLPLTEVGISGKTVWIKLPDIHGGRIPFTARILVDLAADRRGIHMSRIEQAISSLHDREFSSPADYGGELGRAVLKNQEAGHLSLELSGKLPLLRKSPVTRLRSIDAYEAGCKVILKRDKSRLASKTILSAEMFHLTACPCTLAYNEILFNRSKDSWPQATHSQRSKTKLQISPPFDVKPPDIRDLREILDSALHVSQDLLKRPDETELVLKAHRSPQFAEDAVREVARAAGEKFRDRLEPETEILIHTLSLESIHIHDVECSLKTTLKKICAAMVPVKQEY